MSLLMRPLGGAKASPYAELGAYFVGYNTTPGTGIAGHAAPTSADSTKPLVYLYNRGPGSVGVDYIRVRMTAIGAGATTTDFSVFVDQSGAATRSSGGTLMATPACTNTQANRGPNVDLYIGDVVTVPVAARQVGHQRVRSVVPVIEDQYVFTFGAANAQFPSALATSGTAIVQTVTNFAPVVIGPKDVFEFVEWGASQSGAHSFDVEIGLYLVTE